MSERWTRGVLGRRWLVVACWLGVLVAGLGAGSRLGGLLSNSFAVPSSGSARAGAILAAHFGERPESTFVVVFPVRHGSSPTVMRRYQRLLARAADAVPTGRARPLEAGGGILYGDIVTRLSLPDARAHTTALRAALAAEGTSGALVTGQPAIARDLEPILASDLRRGELVAIPVALLVLALALGLSAAVLVPFGFAACTVGGSLLAVFATAHVVSMPSYVTNLVALIGFGLAVDYSLLLVHRFREELEGGSGRELAIVRTMASAGRTIVFSGSAVAVGLALLLFVPVPFVRALGIGALVVPIVSLAAVATLQPVMLSLLPLRGLIRPTERRGRDGAQTWERLAGRVVRHRVVVLVVSLCLMLGLAVPGLWIRLVPGSFSGIPAATGSARGLLLLQQRVSAGAVTPIEIAVDSGRAGGARIGPVARSVKRLSDELFHDPDVLGVASGRKPPYTDPSGRYARVVVIARHEYGSPSSQALVHAIRARLVTRARFAPETEVEVGGAPAQGLDFLDRAYGAFPWLVLAVLAITFAVLVRAFRSLLLPLEAVLANLLTAAAVYGVLVTVFQWGLGARLVGLPHTGDVEGWIPVFLFAALFGLSMDYEVFLVMRMREGWAHFRDPHAAVAYGLARTGRIVTAAALVMAGALSGFVTGAVPGLQELGLGLGLAIVLDATIVRMLLVPALVALTGRWSWWLPRSVAALVRVPPDDGLPRNVRGAGEA